jgi:hypothetical protein
MSKYSETPLRYSRYQNSQYSLAQSKPFWRYFNDSERIYRPNTQRELDSFLQRERNLCFVLFINGEETGIIDMVSGFANSTNKLIIADTRKISGIGGKSPALTTFYMQMLIDVFEGVMTKRTVKKFMYGTRSWRVPNFR